MSCEYCKDLNGKTIFSGDGDFFVGKCVLKKADGSMQVQPILRYRAFDTVFSVDVEVEDYIVIEYCPMCGADLAEALR